MKFAGRVARSAINMKIRKAVFCDELKAAIERVERIGISLRNPATGEFYRTQALGQPGPYAINFNGKRLKPAMAKEVQRLGCQVLDRVQVINLFFHEGGLVEFTEFNIRTDDFYQIRAKAIIISRATPTGCSNPRRAIPLTFGTARPYRGSASPGLRCV